MHRCEWKRPKKFDLDLCNRTVRSSCRNGWGVFAGVKCKNLKRSKDANTPAKTPQRIPHSGSPPGGPHATDKVELPIQRTDTSVQATRMHCMDHKHSIHNVKVCWSFRWIKQYTHVSVARFWKMCPTGEDFQRKSQKLRYLTDRYMCTSSDK